MANIITLNAIPQQTVGAAGATVSGTWTPSAIAKPTLQVKIGTGALGPLPAGATVPAAPSLPAESFSFQIPSFTAAGTFAVLVSDGTVSASVNVVVVAATVNSTPDNTFITTVGPVIWDTRSPPHSWALKNSGGAKQLQITENGTVRAETNNVTILGRTTGANIHQFGGGAWWKIDTSKSTVGDVWVQEADPRPAAPASVTDITLSNTTIAANQPAGTVVGQIGITMSSGTFPASGTIALSGAQGANFSINSSKQLVTASSRPAETDAITITTTI